MNPRMKFVPRKKRLFRLPLRRFVANRNVKDRLFCYIPRAASAWMNIPASWPASKSADRMEIL